MRSRRLWWAALLLGLATLGCSSPQSYIVLLLASSSTPIANIAQVTVVVSQGTTEMQTLTYPAGNLVVINNSDAGVGAGTLSVSFSGNQTGDIKFVVTALDIRGCGIGVGTALISIIKGATNEGIVFLAPEESCTGDAGAPDLPPGSSFPGCDPSVLSCPTAQSCQIDCQARSNICAAAGTSVAGGTCSGTPGCAAGSQCFDYSALGCVGSQVCLRFCATDADCAALGDGGVGPGSFCRDPVACGGVTTAYHTCTFSCDPTAAAATAPSSTRSRSRARAQRLPHRRYDLHRRPEADDLRGLFVIARRLSRTPAAAGLDEATPAVDAPVTIGGVEPARLVGR